MLTLIHGVLAAMCISHAVAAAPITSVPFTSVSIGGSFWGPRLEAVRERTLAANRHQCDITGRIANFERAAAKLAGDSDPGPYQGLLFNDSDVYKMMEGWADLIATDKDAARRAALETDLDALIAKVAAAQHPDGYINTYYTLKAGIENRFTREQWDHETYCMGHLIEAGVAHFQATQKRTFLDVAIRAADYLNGLYGKETFTVPTGHQELELALIRLADITGEPRYLDLAEFLIEQRGRPHRTLDGLMIEPWGDYAQDHAPVTEQREAAGHAVRAGYMYTAMADLALHGRGDYMPALHAIWEDVTQRRIFVTGGIGPSAHNEGFTSPYDIPTHSAYQETCASIALCMWAHRMFLLTGDGVYMDQFERTLYNAVLAGVSPDGDQFFYVNPLASRGGHARRDWYECACCPPNVLRFFATLGQHVYAVRGDTVYVNLLMSGSATVMVGETPVRIEQETDYPFGDRVRITINNTTDHELIVAIRWPADQDAMGDGPRIGDDGYVRTRSEPGVPHTISLRVPLAPRRVYADPRVKASVGRVAIMRGPLVYAAESIDNESDVHALLLPPNAELAVRADADVPTILASALRATAAAEPGLLYSAGPSLEPAHVELRPYYSWANRGPSELVVWLPESAQVMDPQPPKGIKVSASFLGHGDGPGAIIDRIEPSGSDDHSVPRFTFWPHKGKPAGPGIVPGANAEFAGREWVRIDSDAARRISELSVYWFDDTGRGQCRVPRSWAIEWLDGDAWKSVSTAPDSTYEVEIDRANTVRFDSVMTRSLRVVIDLQEDFSAGIFELSTKE